MGLPQLARFPVLIKHKMCRIIIVAVQFILNAALFGARNRNQLFQLCLDQINLIGVAWMLATTVNLVIALTP